MNPSRALLPLLVLLLTIAVEAKPVNRKETLESGGRKRVIHIHQPELPSEMRIPMLLLLHGSGRNGPSILNEWKRLAGEEGIILVAPDALDTQGWGIPIDGPEFLADVVEHMIEHYPVDAKRVYVFGHSAGAVFALRMAPMQSELFAAAGAHAGSLREEGELAVLAFATRKVPVFFIVGDRDPFFPLAGVRSTREAFEAQGFPTAAVEIPRHDHDYYRRSASINRQVWDFLSQHELEENARPTPYSIEVTPDGQVLISPQ
jgi:poly(3-hydroxybutyrate) depolymerase